MIPTMIDETSILPFLNMISMHFTSYWSYAMNFKYTFSTIHCNVKITVHCQFESIQNFRHKLCIMKTID